MSWVINHKKIRDGAETTFGGGVKRALAIFGVMLLITVAHYVIPPQLFLWHEILKRLYYLPIIFGALSFGLMGGLLSAACAAICYAPHIIISWNDSPEIMASNGAEIVLFLAVGMVAGALSDRERRRAQELQRTTDQLAKVYAQLQTSFDQLRLADRLAAIGQLAASLAHEIRNPLGSIDGAIDICQRTTSDEKRREFLAIIKKEAGRLNGLLTDLLDFARPRTPQMRQVRIDSIMKSVVDLISHNAQQRGVRLKSEVPRDFPLVECDSQQITQALLNVVLNAVQATPSGGTVSLSVSTEDERVLLRVRDEGSGIGAGDLERIFDPFYTTKESGTGLGLSVSYQILGQHQGRIRVERNSDTGMTLILMWPIRRDRPEPGSTL
ncbi:MAG: ATP-binding protein [Bryobacteraceae bacterium]